MNDRRRVQVLGVVVVVVVLLVGGFVAQQAIEAQRRIGAGGPTKLSPGGLLGPTPRIVFRNTDRTGSNGLLATVPLSNVSGPRTLVGPSCDRVDAVRNEVACLHTRRGIATTFEGQLFGPAGQQQGQWALAGIPSRVRLSPSGRLVADTVFVTGHSYMQVGFSTATVIRRTAGGDYGNLEKFDLVIDGRLAMNKDRNIWGVTFARGDRYFYATAATMHHTWLVRGDLQKRTLTSIKENAECPSLSPDQTRVAYKKRVPSDSDHWSLAVLDLASGRETVLREQHSVDDQVTWLDDSTLLYGLPRPGRTGVSDIWRIGTTPGSRPELAIRDAWSPAVVR